MGKNIRLYKSELVSLVKIMIMENNESIIQNTWGCNKFSKDSEERDWCKICMSRIMEKTKFIQGQVSYVKKLIQEEGFEDLVHNLKVFKKDDPFFEYRIKQFLEVQSILLSDCNQSEEYINKFKREIAKEALFVDNKEEYSLLNKLNTNYSALSYLLTHHRMEKNLIGKSFTEVFSSYFGKNEKQVEEGKESHFINFLLDYFSSNEESKNTMSEVFKTIERTTGQGTKTEGEAYVFLVEKFGKENVKNYSGNYSFVDLFGIDFMVNGFIPGKFIPVQIKNREDNLYGNFKVCENVAMAKSKTGGWIINFYNGNKKINTFT